MAFSSSSCSSLKRNQQPPSPLQLHLHSLYNENDIQAVLFDMDGTLLDSEPLGCRAVYDTLQQNMSHEARQAFVERHYRMEWPLKQQTLGLPGPQWAPIVLEWAREHWGVPRDQMPSVDDFLTAWDDMMQSKLSSVIACPGAVEVVQQLAATRDKDKDKNLKLTIATSSHAQSVQHKRRYHEELFGHFDVIVAGDDDEIRHGKPAPDIYLLAAQRRGVDPTRCIVVEDGLPGVLAGRAAGCTIVAVPDPRFSKEEKQDLFGNVADVVLDDLTQFADVVPAFLTNRSSIK